MKTAFAIEAHLIDVNPPRPVYANGQEYKFLCAHLREAKTWPTFREADEFRSKTMGVIGKVVVVELGILSGKPISVLENDAATFGVNSEVSQKPGKVITRYHVFSTGFDFWSEDIKEAIAAYSVLKVTGKPRRLYRDRYASEEDWRHDNLESEECLIARGPFPC